MVPLAMISEGEVVRLVALRGGREMKKRLADLGLNIGMTLSVVRRTHRGPLILDVKDSRLAVGRGMAHHMMVEFIR
jgi:ferrous iron transport protein A